MLLTFVEHTLCTKVLFHPLAHLILREHCQVGLNGVGMKSKWVNICTGLRTIPGTECVLRQYVIISLVLQVWKLSPREFKYLAQDQTARKWRILDAPSSHLDPEFLLFTFANNRAHRAYLQQGLVHYKLYLSVCYYESVCYYDRVPSLVCAWHLFNYKKICFWAPSIIYCLCILYSCFDKCLLKQGKFIKICLLGLVNPCPHSLFSSTWWYRQYLGQ